MIKHFFTRHFINIVLFLQAWVLYHRPGSLRVLLPKCQLQPQESIVVNHSERSLIFADLTPQEYQLVCNYMWGQADLKISHGPKPPCEATVVVFFGERGYLKEYVVGPLSGDMRHRDVTKEKYKLPSLPFTARPVTIGEYVQLFTFLYNEVFRKLETELKESFGYIPNQRNLNAFEGMPRGVTTGDRKTWLSLFHDYSGIYIHPLLYNGEYFESINSFKRSYAASRLNKIVFKDIYNCASLKPRRRPTGLGPQQYYVQGKRFSVRNNQVIYLDWNFAFGLSSLTGMRVFDVRFKGERIAYELSVQEAMSVYGSITPGMILTKFLDSSIEIGRFAHELVRGVDCPYLATYVDVYRYIDTNVTQRYRNAICVFEHDTGRPLQHFSDFFHNSYGSLANSALYFCTITAIGNYDYIWDFILYQSGSVEARVHATGYISSSFKVDGSLKFGHQVAENVFGNIHTFRQLQGVKNVFQTKDMKIPHLVENQIRMERDGELHYDSKMPRYLHVASNQTNCWGHQRSYKLQVVSFAGDHLPKSEPEEKSMSWLPKHKDEEQTSSSLYSQNYMWDPVIDFSKYIEDNEVIDNEDLVAWVTAGFLHIPHAEDIPNTVTVGNGGRVLLDHVYSNI
uniref:Amine oxidase n=1 Tax=Electrophorus electricus TaxID=8005 RepID=A0AAY5E9J8_ELEEL